MTVHEETRVGGNPFGEGMKAADAEYGSPALRRFTQAKDFYLRTVGVSLRVLSGQHHDAERRLSNTV
jgi:hypothetical protein